MLRPQSHLSPVYFCPSFCSYSRLSTGFRPLTVLTSPLALTFWTGPWQYRRTCFMGYSWSWITHTSWGFTHSWQWVWAGAHTLLTCWATVPTNCSTAICVWMVEILSFVTIAHKHCAINALWFHQRLKTMNTSSSFASIATRRSSKGPHFCPITCVPKFYSVYLF